MFEARSTDTAAANDGTRIADGVKCGATSSMAGSFATPAPDRSWSAAACATTAASRNGCRPTLERWLVVGAMIPRPAPHGAKRARDQRRSCCSAGLAVAFALVVVFLLVTVLLLGAAARRPGRCGAKAPPDPGRGIDPARRADEAAQKASDRRRARPDDVVVEANEPRSGYGTGARNRSSLRACRGSCRSGHGPRTATRSALRRQAA